MATPGPRPAVVSGALLLDPGFKIFLGGLEFFYSLLLGIFFTKETKVQDLEHFTFTRSLTHVALLSLLTSLCNGFRDLNRPETP